LAIRQMSCKTARPGRAWRNLRLSCTKDVAPASRELIMSNLRRFGSAEFMLLLIVFATAAASRVWYLCACAENGQKEGSLQVQDPYPRAAPPEAVLDGAKPRDQARANELDMLVQNLKEQHQFAGPAPLAGGVEVTAHTAPGYAFFLAGLELS